MAEKDKHGNEIKPGDHVYTKVRGGRHEGEVEQIVETPAEAKDMDVKNPPKVLLWLDHVPYPSLSPFEEDAILGHTKGKRKVLVIIFWYLVC